MSDFPVLKTGAVTQYPLGRALDFRTRVLRFIDGSEQRFRGSPAGLRRWTIRLDLLNEDEMAAVAQFFELQRGRSGTFRFVDPHDGREYPACRFDQDECEIQHSGEGRAGTVLAIKEERS